MKFTERAEEILNEEERYFVMIQTPPKNLWTDFDRGLSSSKKQAIKIVKSIKKDIKDNNLHGTADYFTAEEREEKLRENK